MLLNIANGVRRLTDYQDGGYLRKFSNFER